jgi:hypothetical protein
VAHLPVPTIAFYNPRYTSPPLSAMNTVDRVGQGLTACRLLARILRKGRGEAHRQAVWVGQRAGIECSSLALPNSPTLHRLEIENDLIG